MPYPNRLTAYLEVQGLPLGLLADPLPYVGTAKGKLHSSSNCRRITRATRHLIRPRPTLAADTRPGQLCTICGTHLPKGAHEYLAWCDLVAQGLRALAACGRPSPYSRHLDVAAEKGRRDGQTWRTVVTIDQAARALTGIASGRDVPAPEIAPIVDHVKTLLAQARAEVIASLPEEAWTRPHEPKMVVGLRDYAPDRSDNIPAEEMYARAQIGACLPFRWAYAIASPGLVPHLRGSVPLGLAEPGDNVEVLTTAVKLLKQGEPLTVPRDVTRPEAVLETFTQALTAARAIHAPALR